MTTLEEWLQASLAGPVASKYELPTETELNAIHAQLARGASEQRRFSYVEITDDDGTGDDAE